jgi:hypothetical protein
MEDQDTFKQIEDILADRVVEDTPKPEDTDEVATVSDSDQDTTQETAEVPEVEAVSQKRSWRDPDIDWDGLEQMAWEDREALPPPIRKKLAAADRHFQEKNQELIALQQQYREAIAKAQDSGPKAKPESEDAPPKEPGSDATQQDYDKWVRDQARWEARQEIRQQYDEVKVLKEAVTKMQQRDVQAEQQRQENYAHEQIERIKKMDGYSSEVEDVMADMAATHPHWKAAIYSQEGIDDLFLVARQRVSAKQSNRAQVQLETTAATRAVSKPGTKGSTTRVKEDLDGDTVGDVMEKLAKSGKFGPDVAGMFR